MPWLPFEKCRERVVRADAHRKSLAQLWKRFIEDDPYSPLIEVNDDGTGSIHVIPQYEVLPAVFALEMGEMLYQLRAALDGSIYAAAIMETGKNPPCDEDKLEFPITNSAHNFDKALWKLGPLLQKRRDIIESVQPYNVPEIAPELMVFNSNRALGILNDWARKDRHRQLHILGSWASKASPRLHFPSGVSIAQMIVNTEGFLEAKNQVASFRLNGFIPGMEVRANPDLMIDIAVNEPPPPSADNDILGNRLAAMHLATKHIIGDIEDSF
jgi:hypothetical protein